MIWTIQIDSKSSSVAYETKIELEPWNNMDKANKFLELSILLMVLNTPDFYSFSSSKFFWIQHQIFASEEAFFQLYLLPSMAIPKAAMKAKRKMKCSPTQTPRWFGKTVKSNKHSGVKLSAPTPKGFWLQDLSFLGDLVHFACLMWPVFPSFAFSTFWSLE